jgi:WD40 repeat protein
LIATGDVSGIVKIVKFDETQVLGSMDAGEHSLEGVCFSPDSKWVAVASMGGAATIWNHVDFQMRHALAHPEGVTGVKWHPKRPFVVTACCDGAVRVWDARNGEKLAELPGHGDVITAIDVRGAETAEGDVFIITASDDRTVKLWSFVESAGKT